MKNEVRTVTGGVLTATLALVMCGLDRPHIHIEDVPFERSVSTLSYTSSYTATANGAVLVVK
jgi:hypothetical protein